MRNPADVLSNLVKKASEENYVFERLYRNLYNTEFYLNAYTKLAPNPGNLTKGTDGQTIDGMSLKRIESIIQKLKDESYQPTPVRRQYIPKKNDDKKRPLGVPSFDDKLVQEVARMILEAIYNETFTVHSHGFRPNRSCHTALAEIQNNCKGTKWWIEGDIKGFFDNINHHKLIELLRKRINDEKFIRLIWKFLRAGYLEDWTFHKTYSGTPQGGIISPILSNIYLHELDKYIEKLRQEFNSGKNRIQNKAYRTQRYEIQKAQKHLSGEKNPERRTPIIKQIKKLIVQLRKMHAYDPMDSNFKRLCYVRYADDFLIAIHGSKEEAKELKRKIGKFLNNELELEMSEEKTLITHGQDKAKFLGFNIFASDSDRIFTDKNGEKRRIGKGLITLEVPHEAWYNKLVKCGAIKVDRNGKWKDSPRNGLTAYDDLEILSIYNAEIRGLYNYYKPALNVSVLNQFHHHMDYSLYKTFGTKYKSSVRKVRTKYSVNGNFAVKFDTVKGEKVRYFYNEGFQREGFNYNFDVDLLPNTMVYGGRTNLIDRLLAGTCEYCGSMNIPVNVHHVRKLKDIKNKKSKTIWEIRMIERNRKTLALCETCHRKLHAGKLN